VAIPFAGVAAPADGSGHRTGWSAAGSLGGPFGADAVADGWLDNHTPRTPGRLDGFAAADPDGLGDDLSWQERALCAQPDPESFVPEKGGSTREAKRVCLSCEVRAECLEYALGNDERFGIWGGLSERERRRLKKLAG
jgi:WhiB family redox-sensing transcriptional regulator